MDIAEINRITIDSVLNSLSDGIDGSIQSARMQYENINNDFFEESKQKLEAFLFRLYEIKYLISVQNANLDCRRYLTEDYYYQEIWQKQNVITPAEIGQAAYETGVDFIRNQDYTGAGKYFRESALAWNAGGQFNYGITLTNGEGCQADALEGAFWYWEAAKHSHSKAMMNLATAYRSGSGVKQSSLQMLYWYARSADFLEHPRAAYSLGLSLMHEEGLEGNQEIGERLVYASEHMDQPVMQNYIKKVAEELCSVLTKLVYNVE